MRITTKAKFNWDGARYVLESWEGYEYEGQLALAGGGPSGQQKAAAAAQANLSNQLASTAGQQQQFFEKQQNAVNPFYQSRMQSGSPFMNQFTDAASGINARAFAPARQQLLQRLGTQQGLPSGFREQALTDLDTQQARGFDQQLLGGLQMNEQAKQQGAAGLLGQAQLANPLGYYGGATEGNKSIMNAPLASPGFQGALGGALGQGGIAGLLLNKIPF